VAQLGDHKIFVECKYHNRLNYACDVKVALYVHARALDILERNKSEGRSEFWLYTNTRFTSDALQYAKCVGLTVCSWDFPQGKGLKEKIEENHLHPITCLTTLHAHNKRRLLDMGYILTNDLTHRPEALKTLGLREREQDRVLKQVEALTIS
jgi:hypothetical protein